MQSDCLALIYGSERLAGVVKLDLKTATEAEVPRGRAEIACSLLTDGGYNEQFLFVKCHEFD